MIEVPPLYAERTLCGLALAEAGTFFVCAMHHLLPWALEAQPRRNVDHDIGLSTKVSKTVTSSEPDNQ
jgi:hypothetical protein